MKKYINEEIDVLSDITYRDRAIADKAIERANKKYRFIRLSVIEEAFNGQYYDVKTLKPVNAIEQGKKLERMAKNLY